MTRYSTMRILALLVVLALAGCGTSSATSSPDGLPLVPAEAGHLHGIAVNPADGKLYLGTHVGPMVVEDDAVARVGRTTIDLMGFAVAGPDHFYASGHPGPGDDLPNPVGLIESKDGGKTWSVVSRAGESDFHTVAAADGVVVGFDGAVRSTKDGRSWSTGAADVAPASLAVSPSDASAVVATTQHGPARSTDGGATFTHVDGAPVLVFLAWPAEDALWAVAPDGSVHLSPDGGLTWSRRGSVGVAPQAFTAADAATVVVALEDEIVRSTDSGTTFSRIADRE